MTSVKGPLTIALVLAVASCGPADRSRAFAPLVAGDAVPAYSGVTLAGGEISIGGETEQVTLLNVWATWCVPCRKEMPDLEEIYQEYQAQGLEIIGVSVDQAGPDRVQGFIDEVGTTFPIVHDPEGRIEELYPSIGLPNTYLIDRSGTLVKSWLGPLPVEQARELIAEAIG